jgi:ketosteroid isomerase-like protein
MPKKPMLFCALLLLIGCIGCQQNNKALMDHATAQELCTRLWTDYVETVKTLEPDKCAGWFTKDAVLIYPDMPELKGRDSIRAFFIKGFPGMKVLEMTFTLIHFDVVNSKAYTFVTINELEQEGAKPPVHALARCGVVWEQQADSSWKISYFLVNYMNLVAPKTAEISTLEAAIRQADEAWAKAVASKSVEETCAFYDPEALTAGIMTPARGLDAIRRMWVEGFAQKGFSLAWKAERIVITESETMAYSSGTWRMAGPNETGPYLAVWRKQPDGQWKVLIDACWYSRPPK